MYKRFAFFTQHGLLHGEVFDLLSMGVESNFKDVLDQVGKEHPIGVSTHKKKAEYVDSLSKAPNITRHIEKRVNDSLIFYYSIVKTKLRLKVGVRIDRS